MCSRTAGSRDLHILFVLMQPLVCPWIDHCERTMHTTTGLGLGLYSIIRLKLNIIFQLFQFQQLYVMDALTAQIFFVVLLVASELLVPN